MTPVKRLPLSREPLYATKPPTINREHFFMNIPFIESFSHKKETQKES
jgi:hypothetical protein